MKYFRELDLPIFPHAYQELVSLLNDKKIFWGGPNQISLTTTIDQPDNFHLAAGSLGKDWSSIQTVVNTDGTTKLVVPFREKKMSEDRFNVVCSQFRGTSFEHIYTMLKSRFNVGRVRLMKSDPKTCLSWHTDSTIRIHYPLKTQSGCFMVINDEVKHLSQDKWHWTETTNPHTAFNGSTESRIHLVATIL